MFSYISGLLIIGIVFYMAVIYAGAGMALFSLAGLVLMVLSLPITYLRKVNLQESIEVPITLTEKGKSIKILLHSKGKKKAFTGKVVFVLLVENTSLNFKSRIKQSISGGGTGTFQLNLQQAGNYEISLCKVRVYDPVGIFYLSKRSRERANVQVLPEISPVDIRLTEGVRNFVGDADSYDTLRSGDDASETFKLREFQDGDKLKNIHWKLSAKEDKLIVKENSLPRACSTVLLLEGGRENKKKGTDAYLQVAASLSFSLMDKECPHYMAWFSKRYGEIKRIRVDNEESFYEFLMYLLQDFDRNIAENCLEAYREKYSGEVLLHYLVLKQNLALYEQSTCLHTLKEVDLKRSLEELELII
ncbi:MAG: DUF58 domain-containing protein [Lachnospiraceae bacterium]|nr:DUF58 domain-containing protein [Lachnospiraceae bacterium]